MAPYSLEFLWKRWRHREVAAKSAVSALYRQSPFSRSQKFFDSRFLVIDCEMSGLDARTSQLLSIGWVAIEKGRIQNASSRHLLIHADKGAGDSTLIHGLHDSSIAGARSVASALLLLLKQMENRILVFHHAPVDLQFLQAASVGLFRCPLLFSYLDTMEIEKKRLHLQGKHKSLRLTEVRSRYGLAQVNQHNALADAVATAELLLAQANYLGDVEKLRLSALGLRAS